MESESSKAFGGTWRDAIFSFISRMLSPRLHPLLFIVVIGFVLRMVLGVFATYTYDIYHWGVIIENMNTGNGLYGLDGYYYSQPWGYMLGTISAFGDILGIDNIGMRITSALGVEQYGDWHFTATLTTIPFILLIKTPLFICDLAVAYVIRWIVIEKTDDPKKGNIAFALWFLCPLTMVASGVSAMFDSITVLMLLLCVVFLMQDRCFMAGSMFCLSALTKFFPVFLIFVLVAYIITKHKDDGLALKKVMAAVIGAASMFLILMLPELIEGNVMDAFAFLTTRASSGVGSGLGLIESYGTVIIYGIFLIISMLLALRMYRSDAEDIDRTLMFTLMVNVIVLFLYPSTPQYMLLLLPFLIYHISLHDRNVIVPGTVLVFGATIFTLASNFTLFLSAAEYLGVISVDSLMSLIDTFQSPVFGMSPMTWMYYIGGVLQYVGTLLVLLHLYRNNRSGFRPFIIRAGNSEKVSE